MPREGSGGEPLLEVQAHGCTGPCPAMAGVARRKDGEENISPGMDGAGHHARPCERAIKSVYATTRVELALLGTWTRRATARAELAAAKRSFVRLVFCRPRAIKGAEKHVAERLYAGAVVETLSVWLGIWRQRNLDAGWGRSQP